MKGVNLKECSASDRKMWVNKLGPKSMKEASRESLNKLKSIRWKK